MVDFNKIMTVIIALKDEKENQIILGTDGQGTSSDMSVNFGDKILELKIPIVENEEEDSEIIRYEPIHFMVSGSHYLINFLKYAFNPPARVDGEDELNYLYNQFFQSLNNELSVKKLLKSNEGALESDAGLIIVYNNRIFNVYSDFGIVEEPNTFTVHGSGWKIATSVLTNLLTNHNEISKKRMVEEALLTTSKLNIYCNDDIRIKTVKLNG